MNKVFIFCLSVFSGLIAGAQTQNPILWAAVYKSVTATEGEIHVTATIEKNWHTYSQRPNEAIPIPTQFTFATSKNYELVGKTEESGAIEEFDKAFDAKIFVFNEKAEFKQKIKLTGKPGFVLPFKVEFICCNDMMCLPPKTVDLSVKVQ